MGNNKSLGTQGLLLNSQAHTASRRFTIEQLDVRQQITHFWVSSTPATVQKGQVPAKTCRNVPFHFFLVQSCVAQCLHSSPSRRRGSSWFLSGGSLNCTVPGTAQGPPGAVSSGHVAERTEFLTLDEADAGSLASILACLLPF